MANGSFSSFDCDLNVSFSPLIGRFNDVWGSTWVSGIRIGLFA